VVDDAVLLTGEQTQAEKQRNIDRFQNKEVRVLLANIKAGGVGFTLDRADTIIFADRSYNPVDNEQAADRFIPTRKDVEYGAKQIIDLTMAGSVEVGINKLLRDKQNIISYVNTYIDNLGVKLGIL
jgi:SNF2 family DNA or RNA helicase